MSERTTYKCSACSETFKSEHIINCIYCHSSDVAPVHKLGGKEKRSGVSGGASGPDKALHAKNTRMK